MTVSEALQPYVDRHWQFLTLKEAWLSFLMYLASRLGGDIGKSSERIADYMDHVDAGGLERTDRESEVAEEVHKLNSDPTTLVALKKYLDFTEMPHIPEGDIRDTN